jgi:hypothetical protein
MKISQNHAGACFMILSVFTGLFGVIGFAFLFLLSGGHAEPLLPSAIGCSAPCLLSVVCAVAARSLLKHAKGAALIATIAWLLMGIIAVYFAVGIVGSLFGWGLVTLKDPFTLLAALLLLGAELLIGVHLRQRKYGPAT